MSIMFSFGDGPPPPKCTWKYTIADAIRNRLLDIKFVLRLIKEQLTFKKKRKP